MIKYTTSKRWLEINGQPSECERILREVERRCKQLPPVTPEDYQVMQRQIVHLVQQQAMQARAQRQARAQTDTRLQVLPEQAAKRQKIARK